MTSVYRWQGKVEQDREQQVVIKTTADRVPALQLRLRQLHPYELPEFLVLDASGSEAYLAWVGESARGAAFDRPGPYRVEVLMYRESILVPGGGPHYRWASCGAGRAA